MAYPLFLVKLLIRTGLARYTAAARRLPDGGGRYLRHYSDRLLAAPLAELRQAAALLDRHDWQAIDLALEAPRFDLTPSGGTRLPADRRGYPPPAGLPELRAAVADKLNADHGLTVSPEDEVLITHGATGAFTAAADAFVNPGDRVILLDPTSPLYPLVLRQRRARVRWLQTWMDGGRTCFRHEHLARALRGARLLVVNSPANPTGGILAPEDLEQIAWWADRYDVLLVSDEVYERFRYDGEPAGLATLPKAGPRALSLGSLSKGHGLAALRVGWLAGNRHLVGACAVTAALQTPFVPTLCQQIALTALRQGDADFEPIRSEFVSRRRYAFERLQAMELNPAWPAGGFFLWLPVWELGHGGRGFVEALLRARKVLLTPGDLHGPSGRGYVRLSYAAEDGRLREGLTRLADFLRELRGLPAGETPASRAA